jgi:hypothetical protein
VTPPWPQPPGVFAGGVDFHPITFLAAVREVYEILVTRADTVETMSLEHEAFVKMLNSRTSVRKDGVPLFRLYDLNVPPSTSDLVVEEGGIRFLRLDCLKNDE